MRGCRSEVAQRMQSCQAATSRKGSEEGRGAIPWDFSDVGSAFDKLFAMAGLVKLSRKLFSDRKEHPQSSPMLRLFTPTPFLHLFTQSHTVLSSGDETPEPERSSLGINKTSRFTSLDISTLSHLAPFRHTQLSIGFERVEVKNCLIKPFPYQMPTTYNPSCLTKCPLVIGDL